jgi:hypothetical protein
MRYSKIIQIIPAEGWFALFQLDDPEEIDRVPLSAWGLTEEGSVVPLVANSKGEGEIAAEIANLVRVEHESSFEERSLEGKASTRLNLFPEDRIERTSKARVWKDPFKCEKCGKQIDSRLYRCRENHEAENEVKP